MEQDGQPPARCLSPAQYRSEDNHRNSEQMSECENTTCYSALLCQGVQTLLQLFFCLDSCKKIFTLTQLNGTWPEPNQNIRYRDESSCVVHSQFNYHQRRITTGEYSIRDKVGEESQKLLCQIIKPSDFEDSSCQPVLYFSRHSIIKLSLKLQCLLFWPLKGDGTNWKHWHIIT